MLKKILAFLLIMLLLFSLIGCSDSGGSGGSKKKNNKNNSSISSNNNNNNNNSNNNANTSPNNSTSPIYCGTWEDLSSDTDSYTIDVTTSKITIKISEDGENEQYGPYNYIYSADSSYTYLEFNMDGELWVLVLLNQDMVALCYAEPDDYYTYTGVTGTGTRFDADISGNWFYRRGAGTNRLPDNLRSQFEELDVYSDYIYYPNAQVIAVPDYWGWPAIAVTTDGELSGMEGITLITIGSNSGSSIRARGNFIITDFK